ncbi:neural cell adhesion molecule 2-like isoform X2 [Liolophura sinensis]|uniref:neural cell adhesion molecule 2-like isoform X2 n=1 Tax=Liolophura sinensis TaxID=3198878 RepID=UPI003157F80B
MATVLILSIISLCLVEYSGAQSLVLVPGDQTQPKKKGFGLIIKCDATGLGPGEDPQLTWTNAQGNVITSTNSNDPVYVQGKGTQSLKLRILSVQGEHAGKWICSGVLGGQTQTKDVIFDVWEDITFTGKQYQRPTIYTDALIECRVGGSPQPEVSWSHKGKTLERGRYIPKPNGLEILNITKNDNGEYLCKAEITSRGRYEEHPITVEVKVPPTLTSPPKMTKGIEGKDLTMYCKASGDPPPTYKWYKDQSGDYVILNNGGRYEISEVEGTLKILRLEVSDDGTYKCVASNLAGPVEATAEVDVMVPPKIIQQDHGEGISGGTTKMLCVATGDPAPDMKWHKIGEASPFQNKGTGVPDMINSRVTVTQNKERDRTRLEMQIVSLEPSDISNYTCSAYNEAGNDTKNTSLNVLFKPQFNNNPSDVAYTWSGAFKRNITCIVDSNPPARIVWKRGNKLLENNGTFTINTENRVRQVVSNLTVLVDFTNEGFMFGDYVCEGSNNQGTGSTVINLRQATLPHPPSTVDVVRAAQRWIRLRIGAPSNSGGLPVTGYRVQYSTTQGNNQLETIEAEIDPERTNDDDSRPKTTVDIENLNPSTLYTISVYARTDVGLSDPRETQFTTKKISVPEPVNILSKTVSDTSSEYNLVWEKPRDGGSPIKHYIIRYRRVTYNQSNNQITDIKSDFKVVKQENPEATSFKLTNLIPERTYQIEIDAVNGVGKSETRHIVMTTKYGSNAAGDGDTSPITQREGLSTGAIVGLVIIIFFILLLFVDVTCYFKNRCGIIMCVRENVCGKPSDDGDRHVTMEEGDAKETQPLAEKEKPGDDTKGTGAENQADTVEDEKKQPLLDNEDKTGDDVTGTDQSEPEKMEEKEPEDKEEKIEEHQVEECKEAKEEPPVNAPEAEVQPSSDNTGPPAEKA